MFTTGMFTTPAITIDEKQQAKDVKELKTRTKVSLGKGKTIVLAVATALNSEENKIIYAPCKNGIHVCNTVYDVTRDSFVVEAVEVYTVGEVSVHYYMEMEGVQGFRVHLPLPEKVVKRYITESEKKKFDEWKASFPSEKYNIKLLQMVTSNG
jgi:hypothetical protein